MRCILWRYGKTPLHIVLVRYGMAYALDSGMTFKDVAKLNGFFASGNEEKGFRIAVGNVTGYKKVALLTVASGYTISDKPVSFPSLVLIKKA